MAESLTQKKKKQINIWTIYNSVSQNPNAKEDSHNAQKIIRNEEKCMKHACQASYTAEMATLDSVSTTTSLY